MPPPQLSDEVIQASLKALREHGGNKTAAARSLKLPRMTFIHHLDIASRRGMMGPMPEANPGFEVRSYSEQTDKDGNVKGRSVRYGIEHGEEWEVPAGATVKRGTVQLGPDGRIEREWARYSPEDLSPVRAAEIITEAFAGFKPFAPAIIRAKDHDQERLTVYIIADWHVGMFAWSKETGGPDWDLSIARSTLSAAFNELVEQSPPSYSATVLGLGDILHADSHKNMTPSSGNVMDVDTRYSKCLPVACELIENAVERVRAKHRMVNVSIKEGNHDIASTVGIRCALDRYYRNTACVTVDSSPNPFFWQRFGVNLIGGTHGHHTKPQDLPMVMANVRRQDWAETISRHFHTGHIHHDTLKEVGGVRVYSHRAPIPQDAYHSAAGYLSGRSMRSFTYHRQYGARGTSEVELP